GLVTNRDLDIAPSDEFEVVRFRVSWKLPFQLPEVVNGFRVIASNRSGPTVTKLLTWAVSPKRLNRRGPVVYAKFSVEEKKGSFFKSSNGDIYRPLNKMFVFRLVRIGLEPTEHLFQRPF